MGMVTNRSCSTRCRPSRIRARAEFYAIETGYGKDGEVALEDGVLVIEQIDFTEDGGGPHYLYCGKCERAYRLPDEVDFR